MMTYLILVLILIGNPPKNGIFIFVYPMLHRVCFENIGIFDKISVWQCVIDFAPHTFVPSLFTLGSYYRCNESHYYGWNAIKVADHAWELAMPLHVGIPSPATRKICEFFAVENQGLVTQITGNTWLISSLDIWHLPHCLVDKMSNMLR